MSALIAVGGVRQFPYRAVEEGVVRPVVRGDFPRPAASVDVPNEKSIDFVVSVGRSGVLREMDVEKGAAVVLLNEGAPEPGLLFVDEPTFVDQHASVEIGGMSTDRNKKGNNGDKGAHGDLPAAAMGTALV